MKELYFNELVIFRTEMELSNYQSTETIKLFYSANWRTQLEMFSSPTIIKTVGLFKKSSKTKNTILMKWFFLREYVQNIEIKRTQKKERKTEKVVLIFERTKIDRQ